MELAPGTEIAGYRVDRVIGRGGMGVVYLAEQRSLNRMVALKVVAPELAADEGFRARFVREAQLAASLEHPNIIPIHDAGEVGDTLFISMRYVPGLDLDRRLDEGGALPLDETVDVMRQAGSALDAAHGAGLVHRDVKPANILIASGAGAAPEGRVFLTDFGLTKRLDSRTRLTKTGFFLGTVAYSSPEQLQGREVDGRTDVYSLVCVLYQCLTGALPFQRDTDPAMVAAHLMDPPPAATLVRPDLPAAVDDLVRRGMAKSPDDRFATCGEVVDELQRAIRRGSAPRTVAAPPPAAAAPPPPPPMARDERPAAAEARVPTLPPMPPTATPTPTPTPPAAPARTEVVRPAAAAAPGADTARRVDADRAAGASVPPAPRERRSSNRLAVWGSALLVFAGLLELVGGRHGIDHVVDEFDIALALGTFATGVVALALALTSRAEHGFRRGVLAGVGLAALTAELGFLVVTPSFFFQGGLVDELATMAGGALIVFGLLQERPARAPRPSRIVLAAAIGGFMVAAIPLLMSWLPGVLPHAGLGVYVGLAVGEVVVLASGIQLRAGASAGIGFTVLAVWVPLVAGGDSVPGYVIAAVVGGMLVAGAGFLDRRAVAGTSTSPAPLAQ